MADLEWDEIVAEAGDRFNVPPEGKFPAVIEETEVTTSKSSGAPMIVAKLKIAEGPHAGKRPKKVYVVKSAKAAGLLMGHLKAVGIDAETLKKHKPTMAQIAAVMVGKRVNIEIKHEEYRGETQAVVNFSMRQPEGGAVAVTSFPPVAAEPAPAAGGSASGGYSSDPGF